jgi:hypothetical protein
MMETKVNYCPECGFFMPHCDCNTELGRQRKLNKQILRLQEQVDLLRDMQLQIINEIHGLKNGTDKT